MTDGIDFGRTPQAELDRLRAELNQARVRLVEELKSSAGLRDELRNMELRLLQSQINPHFLFNTLATIGAQATLETAPATSRLVLALSRLLRYNLRRIKDTVPLQEEIAAVQDYLLIQQTRFEGRLAVEVTIHPDVLGTPVPVLTVQPLVENAVLHGLEGRADGLLRVLGRRRGMLVEIEVIDNGQGMSGDRLREVLEGRESGSGLAHTTGLGIYSVDRRIKYYFGSDYGVALESRLGRGTRAILRLPYTQGARD
jgi:sensor histidine kinase YesM